MEHIRNIQIQISETTAAWWKKSIISLWLRPINIIVYPLDSCYGSMVATFLGRPPGRPPGWNMVKRHSPSTPFYPVLQKKISHEMPSRSPYVAYILSFFLLICISSKMQKLPLDFSNHFDGEHELLKPSGICSGTFRYSTKLYQTFMALFENRLPPKFDDHLLIICWSSVDLPCDF